MFRLSAQFVTDVETCAERARLAAGDRNVMMHGADAAQALLRVGLLDEPEVHLVPVRLGDRRPLFSILGLGRIELKLVRRMEPRDITHLRYRVQGAW
jgi:dihydrofolate reductase